MKLSHFNRRLHLYLALALLPWFLMYGISSGVMSHPSWMGGDDGGHDWTPRFEKTYDGNWRPDLDEPARRALAGQLLRDNGFDCSFGVDDGRDGKLGIWCFTFLHVTRLNLDLTSHRLTAEDQRFRWEHFWGGLHGRGGFEQDRALPDLWAVMVDLVCLGFVLWAATGLCMWWELPHLRRWGAVAIGSGAGTFILFMLVL